MVLHHEKIRMCSTHTHHSLQNHFYSLSLFHTLKTILMMMTARLMSRSTMSTSGVSSQRSNRHTVSITLERWARLTGEPLPRRRRPNFFCMASIWEEGSDGHVFLYRKGKYCCILLRSEALMAVWLTKNSSTSWVMPMILLKMHQCSGLLMSNLWNCTR